MPTLSITKAYADGDILLESDLDEIRDALLTFLNTTKIDADNIQADAIDGSLIADDSIDSEHYVAGSIDNEHMAADSIDSAQYVDGSIDPVHLAALGQQLSSSSGAFSTVSATYVDVTNLSVSITTTGRPVMLMLLGTSSNSFIATGDNTSDDSGGNLFKFLRDSTGICETQYRIVASGGGASTIGSVLPPSCIQHVDIVGAGTYTYKLQAKSAAGTPDYIQVNNCKLIAYEL